MLNYRLLFREVLLVSAILWGGNTIFAQPLELRQIQSQEGSYQDFINCLTTDAFGTVWFGTRGGAYRYDGYEMEQVQAGPNARSSISSSIVYHIHKDSYNRLWFITSEGIELLDADQVKLSSVEGPAAIPQNSPQDIPQWYEIRRGEYLIAWKNGKYFRGKVGRNEWKFTEPEIIRADTSDRKFAYGYPFQLKDSSIWQVRDGYFSCIVEGNGKWGMPGQRIDWAGAAAAKGCDIQLNLPNMGAAEVCKTSSRFLVLYTRKDILVFDPELNLLRCMQKPPDFLNEETFRSVIYREKELWTLPMKSDRLLVFDLETGEIIRNSVVGDQTRDGHLSGKLATTPDGSLWYLSYGVGLYQTSPDRLKFRNFGNLVVPGNFRTATRLPDNSLTGNSTRRFNFLRDPGQPPGEIIGYIPGCFSQEKPDGTVLDHFWDAGGKLWVAYETCVARYAISPEGQIRQEYAEKVVEKGSHIMFSETPDHHLLLLTFRGIYQYVSDESDFEEVFSLNDYQQSEWPFLHVSSRNIWWMGTHRGLLSFDPATRKTRLYNQEGTGLSNNQIFFIQPDPENQDDVLWLATAGGLNRFDTRTQSVRVYRETDGLCDDMIYAIQSDEKGRLWISTQNGLSCFDPETGTFENYYSWDGLPENGFNRRSYGRDKEGNIYFGSTSGMTVFNPATLHKSTFAPPILFTRFRLNNKIVDFQASGSLLQKPIYATDTLILSYLDNAWSIEFAALDYRNPDRLAYSYFLEGFNDEWQEIGSERKVTFTNLAPGKYILKVRSTNADGVWAKQDKSLVIFVTPPWYATWWARMLFLIAFLGGVFFLYRFQLNRRMEKAETSRIRELEQLKSRLYTNFTHEFRTPLTVIKGLVEESGLEPAVKSIILRNNESLLQLVNQLLDLAKMDAGQLVPEYRQADIIAYLRYLTESLSSLAERKGIHLEFSSQDTKCYMDFDEERIKAILINLLSNAIKFTPKKGKVEVKVRRKETKNGEWLKISVMDNGRGIPVADLDRVFERFSQVLDGNEKNTGGTGIGLTMVKELTELFGGEVKVKSEAGKGSTFTVTLPITRKHPPSAPVRETLKFSPEGEKTPPPSPEKAAEVLIVEDNPDLRQYMTQVLGRDFRIRTAPDGAAGIQAAFDDVPDIVITDVMMPHKDGFEVCETLKNDVRTSHIPIIMLTAKAEHADKIAGLKVGANAYLAKPFDKEELLLILNNLGEDRRRLQEKYLKGEPTQEPHAPMEDEWVQSVREFVHGRLSDDSLSVPDLAEAFHLSQVQLTRKLKALTGMPPVKYIRYLRLEKAADLLRSTSLNISEIAYDCGFSDPAYFTRAFGKQFGQSPTDYRG